MNISAREQVKEKLIYVGLYNDIREGYIYTNSVPERRKVSTRRIRKCEVRPAVVNISSDGVALVKVTLSSLGERI